ncbi:DUF1016 N-terminal domain-containing protein [Dyadobacter chenwenxiniae]|uniref:DUF1016 N-terminal domain-containing protein n=1 Tax=Dyadobacter chenwenxiniae TaxID=2906456 RepID=A0A9X1PNZ1_9BACT|nr:DUF1016 N-terminal domain-containing protein [Dyadobacter chenwenxiniae]MCF0064867.1 DUF1016 N-terminal domain-containing protein [Dyadobacter chenwenxiniae]UON82990.1 DUF1016 N-terminal domain-containing protein [Dyadobacter chenwenxiniae]
MNGETKPTELISSVKQLIKESRARVAVAVNAEITMLYYQIGKRINDDVLRNSRAEYGKQIVSALSADLILEYGSGWGEKHLRHCMHFANVFSDSSIVYALRRQLSWTHFKSLMYIDDELKRA